MSQKDFLSQFSGSNGKPDSFKEEERIPVSRNKKPLNKKVLIIVLAILLVVGGVIAFFLFRPTIEVKDFVGSDSSEVTAWLRQNEIETKGVIFKEEYNFDYDKGVVVYQSVEQGKKIRKDTKMDFIVSLGADPDEVIKLPNIMSMSKDELQDWSKENKLTKTKIMSTYSDEVEDGQVIKYEVKGVEEDAFTRSSTLNITVSKGPQPAGVVTVPDFNGKYYTEVETWGKTNKIEITKVESYSDKIEKDKVISQSIEAKKEIKEGDSLTVYVSLGKGIKLPNFKSMSKSDVEDWLDENKGYYKLKEIHDYSDVYVLEQSIPAGSYIGEDKKVTLTINLGSTFYLTDIDFTIVGNSYDKFKDFAEELEETGIEINPSKIWVDSDEPREKILAIREITDGEDKFSTIERLPLEVKVVCEVSNGSLSHEEEPEDDYFYFYPGDYIGNDISMLLNWANDNREYGLDIEVVKDGTISEGDIAIVSIIKYNGEDVGIKLPYGAKIVVTVKKQETE